MICLHHTMLHKFSYVIFQFNLIFITSGSVCYLKLVLFDKFIQIHRQQLKCDTDVTPKCERIQHPNNIRRAFRVLFPQVLQYPYFLLSLAVKPLLIAYLRQPRQRSKLL